MSLIVPERDASEISGFLDMDVEVPASVGEVLSGPYGCLRVIMSASEWPMGVQRAFEGIKMAGVLHDTLGKMTFATDSQDDTKVDEGFYPVGPAFTTEAILAVRAATFASSIRSQILGTSGKT